MRKETTDKVAWIIFFGLVAVVLGLVALFGWAIIEIVQWITAK